MEPSIEEEQNGNSIDRRDPLTTLSVRYEPQFVQRHFRLTSGTSPFPIATMSAPDNSRWRRHALHQTISR